METKHVFYGRRSLSYIFLTGYWLIAIVLVDPLHFSGVSIENILIATGLIVIGAIWTMKVLNSRIEVEGTTIRR